MGSFFAQFNALCRKNWYVRSMIFDPFIRLMTRIILWKHKWINIVRCLLLPIAYSVFFAEAIVCHIDFIVLYRADHQNFFTTAGVVRRSFMAMKQRLQIAWTRSNQTSSIDTHDSPRKEVRLVTTCSRIDKCNTQ